jgi:uncharacterized damage-inducible protein DinB
MTICQTISIDFDDEMKKTRTLLERVPMDDAHRGFKPHEKSMSLERLATHVAELSSWPKLALDRETLEIPPDYKPRLAASQAELLEIFDRGVEESRAAIAAALDSDMDKQWTLLFRGMVAFSNVRAKVIRSFIDHVIHHRAQLGVYLRMNGIPIPGMYGPSADETFPAR